MSVSLTPIEKTTDVIAAGAVVSPLWMPMLQSTSEYATLFLPILGAAWLIVQIAWKVSGKNGHKK